MLLPLLAACSASQTRPLRTVEEVDLALFMGDWYVIASIPTFIERGAHNAIESYRLNEDGTIATTFTFRKGSFDGATKTYHPTGFIREDTGNAVWGMQFVWPIKAEYRIVYLDEDYSVTIIGRSRRDYVWIMARTPTLPESEYERLVGIVEAEGYDISRLVSVPQSWPETD